MRQHVAIKRIDRGIVDVRLKHAFAQIVEDQNVRRAADSGEGCLVQLGPGSRAGSEDDQSHALPAVAERQHEQARAAIASGLRIANHRTFAVVDLRFFAGCGDDDGAGLFLRRAAELVDEAFDALVAAGKAVVVDQILPDRFGVAALGSGLLR